MEKGEKERGDGGNYFRFRALGIGYTFSPSVSASPRSPPLPSSSRPACRYVTLPQGQGRTFDHPGQLHHRSLFRTTFDPTTCLLFFQLDSRKRRRKKRFRPLSFFLFLPSFLAHRSQRWVEAFSIRRFSFFFLLSAGRVNARLLQHGASSDYTGFGV